MSPELTKALSPWTLGPLALRNRIIKSATNEGMAPGGVPTQALVRHHARIAEGGVGMTTVAYCAVSEDGRTFPDQVVLNAPTVPHLRALTDAVHKAGAAASAQLTHGGAFTFLPKLSTPRPWSASGGLNPPGLLSGKPLKAAMTRAAMDQVRNEFVAGARAARDAGFDAVELHMGHGYLLSQFISPLYNKRRDDWGGSAKARARYPAEVLGAVLDAVGRDMAVSCKISIDEGHPRGATLDDVMTTARELTAAGAHLLVLSAGLNVESPWIIFGSRMPLAAMEGANAGLMRLAGRLMHSRQPDIAFAELYLMERAREIRAAIGSGLAYLGGAKSVAGIERAMREGFDAVVMGRALLHDPALLKAFAAGTTQVSGCNACNECIATMYTPGGTRCVLT
ncbi:MAG TPA: NADH:flavin oxidoreductase, partial [Verrucomicrobiae bacterium]|nr:NADH:flavin oxidoreductase [Verrucomicrobiae bacterium]